MDDVSVHSSRDPCHDTSSSGGKAAELEIVARADEMPVSEAVREAGTGAQADSGICAIRSAISLCWVTAIE
jgi:hypothetical protein